jgi:hypothetical protein
MPQLPEDIIDRLTLLERRLQKLATAVNNRPALNRISGGTVQIADGGQLLVRSPAGHTVLQVGRWSSGQGQEYGVALRRQTGQNALTLFNDGTSATSVQVLRLHDVHGGEIFSDDITAGGIAKPWLALLPPQDLTTANWAQTTSSAWVTIARSFNPLLQPRLRLILGTRVSSGATGQVRVLVDNVEWGPVITAGQQLDHTAAVTTNMAGRFGTDMKVEVQAMVTSASGTVYARPLAMHGTQS